VEPSVAEEEQADDGAHESRQSRCELIVAENWDRTALDEWKSQRGSLVKGQGSGEQVDWREVKDAVGQKNFVKMESCVGQICPKAKDETDQNKCGESSRGGQ
jgi:hypothetical protein